MQFRKLILITGLVLGIVSPTFAQETSTAIQAAQTELDAATAAAKTAADAATAAKQKYDTATATAKTAADAAAAAPADAAKAQASKDAAAAAATAKTEWETAVKASSDADAKVAAAKTKLETAQAADPNWAPATLTASETLYVPADNAGVVVRTKENMADFIRLVHDAFLFNDPNRLAALMFDDKATSVKKFSMAQFTAQRKAIGNNTDWTTPDKIALASYDYAATSNWSLYNNNQTGAAGTASAGKMIKGDPENEFVPEFVIKLKGGGTITISAFYFGGKMYLYSVGKCSLAASQVGTVPPAKLANLKAADLNPTPVPPGGVRVPDLVAPPAGYDYNFPYGKTADYAKFGEVDLTVLGRRLFDNILLYSEDAANAYNVSTPAFASLLFIDVATASIDAAGDANKEKLKTIASEYVAKQNKNAKQARETMKKFYDNTGNAFCVDLGDGGCLADASVKSKDVEFLWIVLGNGANLKTYHRFDVYNQEFYDARLVYQINNYSTPGGDKKSPSTFQAHIPVRLMRVNDRFYVYDVYSDGQVSDVNASYVHSWVLNEGLRSLAEVTRPFNITAATVARPGCPGPADNPGAGCDYSDVYNIRGEDRELIERRDAFRFPKKAQRLYDYYHFVSNFYADRYRNLAMQK